MRNVKRFSKNKRIRKKQIKKSNEFLKKCLSQGHVDTKDFLANPKRVWKNWTKIKIKNDGSWELA